jgi:hypothetical protein
VIFGQEQQENKSGNKNPGREQIGYKKDQETREARGIIGIKKAREKRGEKKVV